MDPDSQDDSANLERRCRYQYVCEFGKNVMEYPGDCVFHRRYQRIELELLLKEQNKTISNLEKDYLDRLSGRVEK